MYTYLKYIIYQKQIISPSSENINCYDEYLYSKFTIIKYTNNVLLLIKKSVDLVINVVIKLCKWNSIGNNPLRI